MGVCDEASAFNRPSIVADAWAATDCESPNRLFQFNWYISKGMAVVWVLVLFGIFQLQVRLHASRATLPQRSEQLIGNVREAVIHCPSGRIGWMDLDRQPIGWHAITTIEPGQYLARLSGRENPDHWNLSDEADYPRFDDDWTLHLAPLP
jgi:hypothetical protein